MLVSYRRMIAPCSDRKQPLKVIQCLIKFTLLAEVLLFLAV